MKCTSDFLLDGTAGEACIPTSYLMDGIADCWDNSDENSGGPNCYILGWQHQCHCFDEDCC